MKRYEFYKTESGTMRAYEPVVEWVHCSGAAGATGASGATGTITGAMVSGILSATRIPPSFYFAHRMTDKKKP